MTTEQTPRTEAGRTYLKRLRLDEDPGAARAETTASILAIEAEARAEQQAAGEGLREALVRLLRSDGNDDHWFARHHAFHVMKGEPPCKHCGPRDSAGNLSPSAAETAK